MLMTTSWIRRRLRKRNLDFGFRNADFGFHVVERLHTFSKGNAVGRIADLQEHKIRNPKSEIRKLV